MDLYKIINGKVKKYEGGFVVLDNKIYTNPTEEIIKQVGYKPLRVDEEPEYDIEKQTLVRVIEETEKAILIHWEVKDIEPIEE